MCFLFQCSVLTRRQNAKYKNKSCYNLQTQKEPQFISFIHWYWLIFQEKGPNPSSWWLLALAQRHFLPPSKEIQNKSKQILKEIQNKSKQIQTNPGPWSWSPPSCYLAALPPRFAAHRSHPANWDHRAHVFLKTKYIYFLLFIIQNFPIPGGLVRQVWFCLVWMGLDLTSWHSDLYVYIYT